VTCDAVAPGENPVLPLDSIRIFSRSLQRRSHAPRVVLGAVLRARRHRVTVATGARQTPAGGLTCLFSVSRRPEQLLTALTDAELEALADRLAPLIAERLASPPGLLTPHEAARRAGVHVETIRRAVRTGALPASRAGRAVRIDADDLDRWLRQEHGARAHAGRRRPRPRAAGRRPLADALARP
jgi:excisionase family DNA binding protein